MKNILKKQVVSNNMYVFLCMYVATVAFNSFCMVIHLGDAMIDAEYAKSIGYEQGKLEGEREFVKILQTLTIKDKTGSCDTQLASN